MAMTVSPITKLPDCVLLQIFKRCKSKADIWRARNVCKRWYHLLADNELWRVCNLSSFRFDDFGLLIEIINYMPVKVLKYLEIHNNVILTDVLCVLLEIANHLHGLRLNGCTIRPGTTVIYPNHYVVIPDGLQYLDVRKSGGNLSFIQACLTSIGPTIRILGVSNNFEKLIHIRDLCYLHYLPNLTMLECHDCIWMNDDQITAISNFCPSLESLNVSRCLNVQGSSIHLLVDRCVELKTLILRRTSIHDENMIKPKWGNAKITEVDLSHCYYLEDDAVNKIVKCLAYQIKYLCCAFSDELVLDIMNTKLPLKSLELRRRHPVNVENIVEMISNCGNIEVLDVSLTPLEYKLFQKMLPNTPNLRWLSLAGNEVLKTSEVLKLLSAHCWKIEEIGINYYYGKNQPNLKDELLNFIRLSPNLHKICIEGAYVNEVVKQIIEITQRDKQVKNRGIQFCNPDEFKTPNPRLCVDRYAQCMEKVFSSSIINEVL